MVLSQSHNPSHSELIPHVPAKMLPFLNAWDRAIIKTLAERNLIVVDQDGEAHA